MAEDISNSSSYRLGGLMNPLQWKRDHQIALACAVILGVILGTMLGLREVDPYGHSVRYNSPDHGIQRLDVYWLWVMLWGLFGGGVSAVLVAIRQLLRT